MKLKNNHFYIMRHGQTVYQTVKNDFVYPWKESVSAPGLTEVGKESIRKVLPEVRKLSIDMICASDFRRTRETAEIVAGEIGLRNEDLTLTPKLRDINLGKYNGGPRKDFYKDLPDFLIDFKQRPDGGETLGEVRERVVSFLEELDATYKDRRILIVSHGEPLWLLEGAINGTRESDMVDKDKIKRNYIQPGELRKLN